MINLEDFKKVEMVVAEIKKATPIDGSDKLLKLEVLADVPRTVVAGISKIYAPSELIGKKIVILSNLKPRAIFGVKSEGMIVTAFDGKPTLVIPDKEVSAGTPIT